jgi:hypothetical protein
MFYAQEEPARNVPSPGTDRRLVGVRVRVRAKSSLALVLLKTFILWGVRFPDQSQLRNQFPAPFAPGDKPGVKGVFDYRQCESKKMNRSRYVGLSTTPANPRKKEQEECPA